jgi:hypothetical protein
VREQNSSTKKREDEYFEEVRETFTGTTSDSLVNSIIDGFKAGKRSAADFADTFEELMQGAIGNALAMASEEKVREYYEALAVAGRDGYAEEKIEYFRK